MSVNFGGNVSGLQTAANAAKGILSNLGSGNFAGAAVGTLAAIAGAAIGVGVASVSAAANFQQSMLKVQAYAGLSKQQTEAMSNSILDMAAKLGQSPKAMADAIYPIISSGYSASQALNILDLSAKTAAASGAKMSTVADMLTTSLKASGAPASQAGHYMDMFNKIVSLGKGEVPQYAAVIGKLTLSAGSAKVPFDQMGAALATLTTHGFPSVAQASTSLGNLFNQVGTKVDTLAAHAKKLGLTFNENAFKAASFSQKLQILKDITHGDQGELLKLLGGSTVALKAFNALSNSSKDLAGNMDAMKNSAGATDAAYKTASTGFNASMQRMKAAGEVLLIKIGQGLLPVLTKITDTVTPIITQFANWVGSSKGVGGALSGLGVIIQKVLAYLNSDTFAGVVADFQTVGNQITNIVNPALQQLGTFAQAAFAQIGPILTGTIIPAFDNAAFSLGQFLIWMQQGSAPAQALGIALLAIAGGFAAIQIGAFIAAIPAIVGGFIAWAAGAWVAAAGTIAATWPLFAIGAAVVIVVALIVLAIKHWGEIGHWLQGVWKAVTGAIGGFFSALGTKVHQAIDGIGKKFSDLGTKANSVKNDVGQKFSDLGTNVHNKVTELGVNVIKGFQWMYQHNTYFKMMVDKIVQLANQLKAWLAQTWDTIKNKVVQVWQAVTGWITAKWTMLSSYARLYFSLIMMYIQHYIQVAVTWVMDKWSAIQSWLTDRWNQLKGLAQTAWNGVVSVFQSIWGMISGPLNTLWSNISSWFTNLAGQAVTWGTNIIQGFINGINSMIGAAGQAAQNVVANVAKFLGFHSPAKEGPGKELNVWGPNMVKGFAQGVDKASPVLKASMIHLVKPMGDYASMNSAYSIKTSSASARNGQTSGSDHITIVELDGRAMAEYTQSYANSKARLKLGSKGRIAA